MKTSSKTILGVLGAVAAQLLLDFPARAKETLDIGAIWVEKSTNVAQPLSEREISSLGRLSPTETASFLKGEASRRAGTDYAKSLIFAAALIERLYPGTTGSVSNEVEKWLKSQRNASVESKLLTVFTQHGVSPEERLSALRWIIAHYQDPEISRRDPKYAVYERILTRDLPGVGVTDLLGLKEIGFLLDVDEVGAANERLRDLETHRLPPECASYLSSLRLRIRLQSSDKPIWKGK
jgi:hypothetical protein